MSKKIISTFYVLSILPFLLLGFGVWLTWIDYTGSNSYKDTIIIVDGVQQKIAATHQPFINYMMSPGNTVFFITCIILASILGMVAWIGTLINLGKAQEWIWFLLVFLFGGLVILIYLFAGPRPLKVGQYLQTQPTTNSSPSNYQPGIHPQPSISQAHQLSQSPSALEILQQRYARGEIDTATYEQMRDLLKK